MTSYSLSFGYRMFDGDYIEHAELLDYRDYQRAAVLVFNGMSHVQALHYLRGWAQDAALEADIETQDAREFEQRSY